MQRIDYVVIGAGIIGLAIARELALKGLDVVVLESANNFGEGISSRNSEVVHAGLYYPPNSLKAKFCLEGSAEIYTYCLTHNIPYRQCGKLIVATDEKQTTALERIKQNAEQCGVENLHWLSAERVNHIEPEVFCHAALLSPRTGIVDSHALMQSFKWDAEKAGAVFVFKSPLISAEILSNGFQLHIKGCENETIIANHLINAAGLNATKVAKSLVGFPSQFIPKLFYGKGNYFAYKGLSNFSHLIYPVPESSGLGVHLTFDMAGTCRFGPDVEWVLDENYDVDSTRIDSFYSQIRRYWPSLPDGSLYPAYAGIRPKLGNMNDFQIDDEKIHGVYGLINLFGIDSPGLTSALSIAKHVSTLLRGSETVKSLIAY